MALRREPNAKAVSAAPIPDRFRSDGNAMLAQPSCRLGNAKELICHVAALSVREGRDRQQRLVDSG